MEMAVQSGLFDYMQLDVETRIVVRQRTEEIKVLVRRSAQDIIDIGNKLIEVKAQLGHGNFGSWLDSEFGWSTDTAHNFMRVSDKFGKFPNLGDIGASALYLLAAPSTPEPVRIEAIQRAQAGEAITHKEARAMVEAAKPSRAPVPTTPSGFVPIKRVPVFDDLEFEAEEAEAYDWEEEDETPDDAWLYAPVVRGSKGAYKQRGSTKRCEICLDIWESDANDCPSCHPVVIPNEWGELADDIEKNGYEWSRSELAEFFAENPEASAEEIKEAEKELVHELRKLADTETKQLDCHAKMAIHYSSDTVEHYTPQAIIDASLALMGGIDLDPCSNSKDKPVVPALHHYTAEDDGLQMPWFGRVYMNPPYGRAIGEWSKKLAAEYAAGDVTEALALVPARTDTQWWQALRNYPVCLVIGRLTFIGNDDPAPFPSAVFYLGENVDEFCRCFAHLGDIWRRINE